MSPRNLEGQRFGRLVVQHRAGTNQHGKRVWACVCDCGGVARSTSGDLGAGTTRSCGCLQRERTANTNRRHGGSSDITYTSWKEMVRRCLNPRAPKFDYYGGRGITVCQEWRDYAAFLRDMGARPSLSLTLDRIDPDGDYRPGNCRWATRQEQSRNQRPRPSRAMMSLLSAEIAALRQPISCVRLQAAIVACKGRLPGGLYAELYAAFDDFTDRVSAQLSADITDQLRANGVFGPVTAEAEAA